MYYKTELYHHGVMGMKWGVRRYQNADGTLTDAGRKHYYGKAERIQKDIDSFKGHEDGIRNKKGKLVLTGRDVSESVRGLEYARDNQRSKGDRKREKDAAKIQSKERKINETKAAVKKYNKLFEKANALQEAADEAHRKSKESYEKLGKTKFSRFIEAFKGTIGEGSEACKRYYEDYDRADTLQDRADAAYSEMRKAYQETGKTYIERVLNNIKYDPDRKK